MPGSTYSTNLKIELMATGENSGTWGDITNTNLGTALEQAIVGYGNPDYASDANLTISITNSNAAQAARALVLNVTSSLSLTATRELVVPTIQKQYIVQNNTTGGQSITVKTSAGTGITVPNGRKAHLYVDGTNVIQMFDFVDINGGAIDGTTIGAASASTGAFTTLNASGATTLDGNVTLGNASGDNVTVTGTITSNLLFTDNTYDIGASGATRPRNLFLAGAATIGGNLSVGGTLTLTGGVNLNGNVTVGDSSSDTLTINSTITSNLLFTDNTYDIGASGATRPRNLFLAGNATIGGNQTLTGSLTVDSTTDSSSTITGSIQTDGGLGVAKALYVGTNVNIGGLTASKGVFTDGSKNLTSTGTLGTDQGGTGLTSFTANGVVYASSTSALTTGSALTFNGTNLFTLIPATGTAYNRTESTQFSTWLQTGAGNANVFWEFSAGTPVRWVDTSAGELMRLTSTGLGIGTNSPAAGLEIFKTSTTVPALRLRYNASTYYADFQLAPSGNALLNIPAANGVSSGNFAINLNGTSITNRAYSIYNDGSHEWNNGAGSVWMYISNSGNIGVNTTSPGRKFVVSNGGAQGFEFGPGVGGGSGNELLNYNRSTSLYVPSSVYASTHAFYSDTAGGTLGIFQATSGNVAIGYGSSAPQKLTISGGAGDVAMLFNSTDTAFHNFGLRKVGSQLRFTEFTNDGSSAFADIMSVDMSGDKVAVGTNSGTTKFTVYESNSTGPSVTIGGANGNGYVAGLRLGYGEGASYTKGAILFENRDGAFARGNLNFCLDAVADSGNAVLSDSKFTLSYTGNAILAPNSNPSNWVSSDYLGLEIGSNGNSIYGGLNGFNPIAMTSNAYVSSGGTTYTKPYSAASGVFRVQGTIFTWSTSSSTSTGQITDFVTALSLEQDKSLALQGATAQSGTGITFPATQSASSNANTLDDYEEGTFTPVLNFGGGTTGIVYQSSGQQGTYVKVGRFVTITIYIYTSSKGSSTGVMGISGLPFGSSGSSPNYMDYYFPIGARQGFNLSSGQQPFVYLANTVVTTLDFYYTNITSGGAPTQLQDTVMNNVLEISLQFTYRTAN